MSDCLSESRLRRLALAGDRSDSVGWAHLRDCPECLQRLDALLPADANGLPTCSLPAVSGDADATRSLPGLSEMTAGLAASKHALPLPEIRGYRVIGEIHRGGQGVVYEAVQQSTNRTVAVKMMLEGPAASERSRWRFEQEVNLVAQLKHPNIVVVHDSGIAQGHYFFAMDHVAGQTLDAFVRVRNLSPVETVRLFVQVCDAVSYAHKRGIIHRDLKRSNILVDEEGRAKVLDFGLAKLVGGQTEPRADVTATGQIMGTVRYMSPEQTGGHPDLIDLRTDVYSLGVILYELVTQSVPYVTNTDLATALRNIQEADPPRPSKWLRSINSELDAIILRALAKEPQRRYQSAEALKDDLAAWLDGRPVSAKSDSSFYVLRKLAMKHYFHTSAILALVAGLVGFGGISYHYLLRTREALEGQRISDASSAMANKDMERFFVDGQQTLRQQAAGWFLLEWREGRFDRARQILGEMKPGSPEHAAMAYLLNADIPDEDLGRKLLPDSAALYHFALGERHLKAGRMAEARAQFSQCAGVPQNGYAWFRRSAAARLEQMDTPATVPHP